MKPVPEVIQLTRRLIRFNTENPPGREKAAVLWAADRLKRWGADVSLVAFDRDRPNLLARIRGRAPRRIAAKKALIVTPHIDTVPIGQGWKRDPLGGDIVGGRLYGRGASDDKGNCAVCMEVVRRMLSHKGPLQRDLLLAITVDEETGSHKGVIPLLKKGYLDGEAAVVVDAFDFEAIIAQKGLCHLRVVFHGKKAHGAYPYLGENAISKAAHAIAAIEASFPWPRHKPHPYLKPPTINVGTINGGDKVNMVPDRCEISLDIRFLKGMDPGDLIRRLLRLLEPFGVRRRDILIDDVQQPYELSARHPLVRHYTAAAAAHHCSTRLCGSEGATVITFFQDHRMPAFATGFGAHGTAHTTDEYVRIKSLVKGVDVLDDFLRRYDEQEPL